MIFLYNSIISLQQICNLKLLQDPTVLAAMQNGLGKLIGQVRYPSLLSGELWKGDLQLFYFQSSGYVASLPAPVRRRIKALKKLQMDATNIEAKFYEEVVKSSRLTQEMITNAEISDPCLGVQVPRDVHPPV